MAKSRLRISAVLVFLCAVLLVPRTTMPAQAAVVPNLDHVFVIVMENHGYGEIIGSPEAPYINSLLSTGGLANNYFAVGHPSLPNYLALVSGSTQGITTDCTDCWVSSSSVADLLESSGKTWKAYEEAMPSPCYVGDSYPYVQKHNPFLYFNSIRTNAARCQSHDVPYTQLATDLRSTATSPNFAFITPDMCHDMHDCSVGTGDAWLQQQVPQILNSPAFTQQNSLLVLTWDEDDGSASNQVATIVLGNGITPNAQVATRYTHYSTLRTVETAFRLPALTANDAAGPSLGDFFGLAGWSRLGGWSWSGPHASSWGATRADAFVVGGDSGLWQNTWNGVGWTGWSGLGGVIVGDPGAVSWGPSRIDVLVRGQDDGLWHRYWNGTAWSGWEGLGGSLQYSPGVASWASGRLDIFAIGADSALWHMSWNGSQWSSWESLGGYLTSTPAAVSWSNGRIDIVARGADSQMWHVYWQTDHWSKWEGLGGQFESGPGVASCGYYRLDIFALGLDSKVWRKSWTNAGWSRWVATGWPGTSDPGAVCLPGTNTLQLLERAPDMSIVQTAVPAS